jgi:hypothetical protein
LIRIEAELVDSVLCHCPVPPRIEPGAELEMIGDTQPREDGCVLGYETNPTELSRIARRRTTEHLDSARCRREETDREIEKGRFPGSVRTDKPDDVSCRDLEGAIGER